MTDYEDTLAMKWIASRIHTDQGALARVQEEGEGFRSITAFVEWLRGNGMVVAQTPPIGQDLIPVGLHAEVFACAFYGIDHAQLTEERLEFIKQYNEEKNK